MAQSEGSPLRMFVSSFARNAHTRFPLTSVLQRYHKHCVVLAPQDRKITASPYCNERTPAGIPIATIEFGDFMLGMMVAPSPKPWSNAIKTLLAGRSTNPG